MENQRSVNSNGDATKSNYNVKLMCSYGGKIQPRPHDHQLTYVGGVTKIIAVDRRINFSDIVAKLISVCNSSNFCLKYQLPGEDLDALVSVINDDDIEHMMAEYDRIQSGASKPARLRLFLFSAMKTSPVQQKTGSAPLNPDFLFGFDKEYEYHNHQAHSNNVLIPDIPPVPGNIRPDIPEKQIPGISEEGLRDPFSRETHVMGGGYAEGGPPLGQPVYLIPVAAGAGGQYGMPTVRLVYREQPVYSFVKAMPATVVAEEGGDAHLAANGGGRPAVYNTVAPPSPAVTMAANFSHDAK